MTDRYGKTKIATIRKRVQALRDAIRAHDTEATEAAWDRLEGFVDVVFREQAQ